MLFFPGVSPWHASTAGAISHACKVTSRYEFGYEAIELLRREAIDTVLLDCQMPVMDGFATCRAIRTLPRCADLPVLAITAHSHSGDRERCLAAGMSDYMAKPVKFEELQALLHDWLLCQPALPSPA
nr:response regulator [Pseudomonas sp. C9-3]